MNPKTFNFRATAIAAVTAAGLITVPVFFGTTLATGVAQAGLIPEAYAAEDGGQGHQGAGGGQGHQGAGAGQGQQGGKSGMDKVLEADETSDRPEWAGGGDGDIAHHAVRLR